jgi:outer membrane protein OmpA-like peptidoglycan-associated protein
MNTKKQYGRKQALSVVVTILVCSIFILTGLSGCSGMSKAQKGAIIGGAAGAAVGGAAGGGKGAVAGGVAGALAGGMIGHYMDKQAEELANIKGAKTERIGDEIRVTFENAILFDFDSSMLKVSSQGQLREMSEIFQRYPDTDIYVGGHTDNTGAEDYNQKLSERRAGAVRDYVVDAGVIGYRITIIGYGEMRPIADNNSENGRSQNRRVEIQIRANDELKAKAEKEAQGG